MSGPETENMASVNFATAWVRYLAKQFDLSIYYIFLVFVLEFIIGVVYPEFFNFGLEGMLPILWLTLLLPVALLLDAILISYFGSSPGRWIAGIKVLDMDGGKLNIPNSIRRNFILCVKGFVFGIPLLFIAGYLNGFIGINKVGRTEWDEKSNSASYNINGNIYRTSLLFIIYIFTFILFRFLLGIV